MMNDDPRTAGEVASAPGSGELEQEEAPGVRAGDMEETEVSSEPENSPPGPEGDGQGRAEDEQDPEGAEDDSPPGGPGSDELDTETPLEDSPADELEAVRDELRVLRDRHLRLAADFENFRKRASADLAGGWVRAQADLVRSLTEGLDDLQRVSQFTSEDTTVEALIEGVDLVERKLLKALSDAGLTVLDPHGDPFDPNVMEAMMRVPSEEDGQDDTVHQVFQKGYLFKDQLVRPARVSVFKDDD
jgi:molecular chaperone GrpE